MNAAAFKERFRALSECRESNSVQLCAELIAHVEALTTTLEMARRDSGHFCDFGDNPILKNHSPFCVAAGYNLGLKGKNETA